MAIHREIESKSTGAAWLSNLNQLERAACWLKSNKLELPQKQLELSDGQT